jgi:molybdopterin converting factor small subunit
MRIRLMCLGQLGRVAGGEKEVDVRNGSSVAGLLTDLSARFGDEFRWLVLDESGAARKSLLVLVNGVAVGKTTDIALDDGDEVKLLPAIAGG